MDAEKIVGRERERLTEGTDVTEVIEYNADKMPNLLWEFQLATPGELHQPCAHR